MPITDVKHVFVLMLENRSFDHLLGGLGIPGADGVPPGGSTNRDAAGNAYASANGAPPRMPVDPPHEYDDVRLQLLGGTADPPYNYTHPIDLSGFVRSYAAKAGPNPLGAVMSYFTEGYVSNLAQLARQYVVCDRWFSSLPGPTVPNRLFMMAGSSNGNPKSIDLRVGQAELGDPIPFRNGTIFTAIKGKTTLGFRIYRGDSFPLALVVDGTDLDDTVPFDAADFAADCSGADLPEFVLIEPDYDIIHGYSGGNSQHPVANITDGDNLIRDVYNGISSSSCWANSLLLITYDEHGGFFDHVPPPGGAAPPGDVPPLFDFDFTQLGVRVPAVVVSPLLAGPAVDHTLYDHTSILATLRAIFPQVGSFTGRDQAAADLSALFPAAAPAAAAPFTLAQPAAALVQGAAASFSRAVAASAPPDDGDPVEGAENAAMRVAARIHAKLAKVPRAAIGARLATVRTKGEARAYLREVDALVKAHDAQRAARPKARA
jgi:phospholipase C